MKKKLQVFISSTYTDMLAERQAVVEAILRAGHIPAGMELFAAGDESQLDTIRRWIDNSDMFMLILGGRYGTIEPNSGKSYIELEYDHAVSSGKPFFAAVISNEFLEEKVRAQGSAALEIDQGPLFMEFRKKVTSKTCKFFKDINDLKLIAFESLSDHERNEKLAGWIHGSEVFDLRSGANAFFVERIPDLLERFRVAKSIAINGITLSRTSDTFFVVFQQRLNAGAQIRLLLVDPDKPIFEIMVNRFFKHYDVGKAKREIEHTFDNLRVLTAGTTAGRHFQVRLFPHAPPYSIWLIDPDEPDAEIWVELHSYRDEPEPTFQLLPLRDGKWFDFFKKQFDTMWNAGETWEPSE